MAWPVITVTPQFLAALRYPHNMTTRVLVTPPGGVPVELPILDGQVTIDRTAAHRRQVDLTISDPRLYPDDSSSPVNIYGNEVTVEVGLRYANAPVEYVQLGVFRLEDASRDLPAGTLTLTGWDRSRQVLDERFVKPRTFQQMLATDLIQMMITEVYPLALFDVQTTDTTRIKRHTVDRDRWPEVQRIAQVIGCEVFPTETGVWRIQDTPSLATAPVVWDIDAGATGVLVEVNDTVTRTGAPNAVIAIGDGPPTVYLADGFAGGRAHDWGTSPSGDDWNIASGSGGDYDVSGSTGRIQAGQGNTDRIQVLINDDADVDATATITFPNAVTGGDLQASLGLRYSADGQTGVRLNLTYDNATHHITAQPEKQIGGTVTALGSGSKDLGSYTAGNQIHVRLRLNGTGVKAKAWNSTEPKGWDWSAFQSDVSNAGRLQARLNRGSANTNSGSPQVTFDDIKATATHTWYSIAHDDDPASPTYWDPTDSSAGYGHVPVFYTSAHIRSQAQADRIASAQLADHLGASRTVTFNAVPNPALDAGDVVLIVRPDGTQEKHILDSLVIPLSSLNTMSGATRVADLGALT